MTNPLPSAEELLGTFNRPLPFSDEAERGVLSCLLQDPNRIVANLHTMPPGLFQHPVNREIFTTLVDEAVEGRPIDPVNVTHRLRKLGRLDYVGGPAAISELFAFVPITSHFPYYLGILRELFSQRKHIEAHARALDRLFSAKDGEVATTVDDIKGIMEEAGKLPGQLLKSYSLMEAIDPLLAEIEERSKHPGKLPGIRTGFPTIDRNTGGMMPGQVWVFAGEPGDGKSTIIQNCAETAAMDGRKVRWYPLEMPHNEQMLRLLASSAQVDNGSLYSGVLTNGEHQAIAAAVMRLKRNANVELVDVEDASATDIFADIERSDCDVVVVDYLQLMEDASARKSDTREGVLASISRRQKRLARRTGKVILTASQLNDSGKLRESRAIGQDADKVFLIKKHADKDAETGFDDSLRDLWCDKNRGGKRHWELPLKFIGSIFQFREIEEQ
jgi:replicative DNA helicase